MRGPTGEVMGVPTWRSHRRWRVFAGVWLIYLLSPLGQVLQRNDGWAQAMGVALIVAFCALYLAWLPGGPLDGHRLRPAAPRALFALSLLMLPFAGESALIAFVFVAVSFVATYPRPVAVAAIAVLLVLAGALPYLVGGWSDDGVAQVVLIALPAAVVLFVFELIRANEQLRQARAELAEMAVLEERERFARDLHDVLGHDLTVITKKAELARRLLAVDPERATREMADVEGLSRAALRDVRATVTGVRETTLADELATAGQSLAAAGIEADLPRQVPDLPVERRVLFGWAVREGVTNVLRHSNARHCRITVSPTRLEVVDDGSVQASGGFDDGSVQPAHGAGHGLRGLAERAEAVGAVVEAGASPEGGGFRLAVSAGTA